jgi:mRNA interferase RelE/StbE
METNFEIVFDEEVIKHDFKKISRSVALKIQRGINLKLTSKPHIFGKALKGSLSGYRSLRVGNYRIIYLIKKPKTVIIRLVEKRETVYKSAYLRFR